MKIAVEIGWGHKPGGARRVAINTLAAMADLHPDHTYVVYSNCRHEGLSAPAIRQRPFPAPMLIPQVAWDQVFFPHLAVPLANRRFKPDVTHYTNNIVSYWGAKPAVVNIYDMTPFVLPESYGRWHGAYQRSYFRFAVATARKVITISEHSKHDICRLLPVAERDVVVVPLAADLARSAAPNGPPALDLAARFGIRGPFLLYVGAIHPRKNVHRLIRAYTLLKKRNALPHQLIIAGAARWMAEATLREAEAALAAGEIVCTGPVSDRELVALYARCDVFVYPSLYEGFGLPVLEAMSLGAPVVTSNTSAIPEVAGDAAVLVDPLRVEELADGIWAVIAQPGLAADLRERGRRRAAGYSWRETARRVLAVLESA